LGVDHPVLSKVAKYFFEIDGGKKMRPTMAILMARAVESHKLSLANRKSPTPAHPSCTYMFERVGGIGKNDSLITLLAHWELSAPMSIYHLLYSYRWQEEELNGCLAFTTKTGWDHVRRLSSFFLTIIDITKTHSFSFL
jgi:geranylgeranyl pyrophosphate synthase